ncbi:cobalt-zinc-cadmium efflux system protein [Rhizobium sp. BK376]|nr:cobalt-zinc-cadmium efflux system protein [Rhizobium sp. BK376]
MAHDHDEHGHSHALGHLHAPANFGKAFAIGVALNGAFVALEVIFGLASNSVSLLADAGHNLSDALGLGVAWAAVILAKRRPTKRFTFGLGGTSILAALFNSVFLLVVVGGLSWEAIGRFFEPQIVAGKTVMIVAACGIVLNGFCAWLLSSGSKGDLNVRGAFLHMAADALVSLGVVVGGLIILVTGWHWIDPLMSLIINLVIVAGTWSLLTGSITMTLNAVPEGIDMDKVKEFLLGLPRRRVDPRPARLVAEHDGNSFDLPSCNAGRRARGRYAGTCGRRTARAFWHRPCNAPGRAKSADS